MIMCILANGVWSMWSDVASNWRCSSVTQQVRYRTCTDEAMKTGGTSFGGAYCKEDANGIEWQETHDCDPTMTSVTNPPTNDLGPVCYTGATESTCGCSKNILASTKERGDGTTQGTCTTSTKRCFSDGQCLGTFKN